MKKVLLLLTLIAAVFVVYNRQRLYLRDPLGSVARDGVKEDGAQIYINYSNDVLLENDTAPMYVTIVQHGQQIGTPSQIKCLHWVACLTDSDIATKVAVDPGATIGAIGGKIIEFRGGRGRQTVITLR